MKIACVTTYDATSTVGWSRRGYYQSQSLKKQSVEIEYLRPTQPLFHPLSTAKFLFYRLRHQSYYSGRDHLLLKHFARQLSKKLSHMNVELVFSPISPASQPISYLECEQPIVIWTDATLKGHMNTFVNIPYYRKMCKETIRDGIANEKSALSKCSLAIYSSEWAAQTAIDNYHIAPSKVKVVPFGPYLERNVNLDDISDAVNLRSSLECKLLFVGTDWHLKGGDKAARVTEELNRKGLKTTLTVVGCSPMKNGRPIPSYVHFMGFINPATQAGLSLMTKLYRESHFLIVPSICEALGVVFAEASSFGVPSIATNVGGIPTMIKDGENGKTFAKDADIGEYCDYIFDLFSTYHKYKELALSSFYQYQSRLNWSVAGQTVKALMMELISGI